MAEDTTSKSTNELLMRVLQVESPELFDGTDDAPVEVTDWYYHEWVPEVCETCGDDPETLTISYRTRKGEEYGETYWDFGLPQVLEALDKWDEKYGHLKNMEDASTTAMTSIAACPCPAVMVWSD